MSDAPDSVRIDVWLWRARFLKTRALASAFIERGGVRLHRGGQETRLDKPSRSVRPGDQLTFALAGRLTTLRIEDLGERRGPATEAQTLYTRLDQASLDRPAPRSD